VTTTATRRPFSAAVWRNRDFVKLWSGQALSQFGGYVSTMVLPLLAIETLHAGASDLGLLGFLQRLPALLYIVAGVWVDRMRKRRTMVITNFARAVLLLMLPVWAALGVLSIGLLGVTLMVSALLTVWFDTSYMSLLPGLVGREHLVEANSRMEASGATAQLSGPALGGLLVQAFTARIAVILDGISVLCSVFLFSRIRYPEPEPEPRTDARGWRAARAELGDGLRFLMRHRELGPLMKAVAIGNIAWSAETTLYVIYLVSTLHLPESLTGLTLIGAGPGAIVGALAAASVARRIGPGGAICAGCALFALAMLLIPLTPPALAVALPMLILASFLMSFGGALSMVNSDSLIQGATPNPLLGKVSGSFRFLTIGFWPLGALAGGLLGGAIGPRAALFAMVATMAITPVLVWFSPVRRARISGESAG
jgi:MFS family permease